MHQTILLLSISNAKKYVYWLKLEKKKQTESSLMLTYLIDAPHPEPNSAIVLY
jgi:hypothetical protein